MAGELSLAQAGVIADTEALCPGVESELVDFARRTGLGPLKDRARERRLEAVPAEELHMRQHRARTFRHWRDDVGMVCLRGALPPEVGVALMNRLDAETDRVHRAAKASAGVEAREAHAADALVTMLSGAGRGRAVRADVVIVCDLFAYRRGHAHPGEVSRVVGGGPVPVSVVRNTAGDALRQPPTPLLAPPPGQDRARPGGRLVA